MKRIIASITLAALLFVAPAVASAHVIVTPAQTDIGVSSLFTVSVPNEKEVAVSSVKLDIPSGVQNVQPDALTGWSITTSDDADNNVTSITWSGTIPVGQREDFVFKAQAPAKATSLDWKAYQTYADGTVVNWDQNPTTNGMSVKDNVGPYSITKVVNDLSATPATPATSTTHSTLAFVFSVAALALSLGSLFLHRRHQGS